MWQRRETQAENSMKEMHFLSEWLKVYLSPRLKKLKWKAKPQFDSGIQVWPQAAGFPAAPRPQGPGGNHRYVFKGWAS